MKPALIYECLVEPFVCESGCKLYTLHSKIRNTFQKLLNENLLLYYPPFTKYRAHDMFVSVLSIASPFVSLTLLFFLVCFSCFIIGFIVVYQTCFNRGCVVLIWFLVCVNINIMKGNKAKYIIIDSW